jgi:polyadenylation factor subunit 2
MAYSHAGLQLLSGDRTGVLKYFTPHLTNIHFFQVHREAVHGISFSPNDERFATGGDDGVVKIWSYTEAREERVLSGEWCDSVGKSFTDPARTRLGCSMRRLASDQGPHC